MNSGKSIMLFPVITGIAILCQCLEKNPVNGIDQTQNGPLISGIIYNNDSSICKGATVSIFKKSALADTVNNLSEPIMFITTSNNSGNYSFAATLEPDMYMVDARCNGNAVLIDSINIEKKNEDIKLAAATLRPMGAIKGLVSSIESDSGQTCYILAFSTNKFVKTNKDGSFLFTDLAEGKYTLRIIYNSINYEVLDVGNIEVSSAETTDIETVTLTERDALLPHNLKLTLDTLSQVVTLSWNSITSTNVKGYNVYRRNVGTNETYYKIFSTINVNDTTCVDSLCIQDQTYEYYVTSQINGNLESKKSLLQKVTISSYITINTTYNGIISNVTDEYNWLFDFVVSSQGDIYLPLNSSKKIVILDTVFTIKNEFATGIFQYQGIRYYDDNIYLKHLDQNKRKNNIMVFSANGNFIDTIIKETMTMSFDVGFGLIAAAFNPDKSGSGDSVSVYSIDGTLKKTWKNVYGSRNVYIKNECELLFLLLSQNGGKIVVCDLDGNKISEKEFTNEAMIIDLAYDSKKGLLYTATNEHRSFIRSDIPGPRHDLFGGINVYDKNYSLVACYKVFDGGGITSITLNDKGNLYIGVDRKVGTYPVGARIIKLNPVNR